MGKVCPILFNGDMVRAILNGQKTVTRRVIKPQPDWFDCGIFGDRNTPMKAAAPPGDDWEIKYPYHPGDIMYVRETFCLNYFDEGLAGDRTGLRGNRNAYKADYRKEIVGDVVPEPKWTPSIHMPKEAARVWLKVTDVRVEQLQDITEEQAKAEGAIDNRGFIHSPENEYDNIHSARERFVQIWDSTIKKPDIARYRWDANPWVWVIEFERCEKPVN